MNTSLGGEALLKNVTNNESCDPIETNTINERQVILLSLIMIVSISLNVLLMLAFLKNVKTIQFSNLVYVSNCVSDFMVATLMIPFYIVELTTSHYFGSVVYVIGYTFDYGLSNISIYNLVVITVHRYFQLRFPLKSHEKMTKVKYAILVSVWLCVILFWLISNTILSLNTRDSRNTIEYPFGFVLFVDIVFYAIPLLLVLFLNIFTFVELKKRNKLKQAIGGSHSATYGGANSSHKHFIRSYICLFCVSLTLIVCFLPYSFTFPLSAYYECFNLIVRRISITLTYFIGIINPIVIFIFQETFRNECGRFITKLKALQLCRMASSDK